MNTVSSGIWALLNDEANTNIGQHNIHDIVNIHCNIKYELGKPANMMVILKVIKGETLQSDSDF